MMARQAIVALKGLGEEPLVGVEIGVYEGRNARDILDELPIEHLYLVDPYRAYRDEQVSHDQPMMDAAMCRMIEAVAPYKGQTTLLLCSSEEARRLLAHVQFDFVYIDGDHRYDQAFQDMKGWWPLVRSGGIMAGHDYGLAGVHGALHDFAKGHRPPYLVASTCYDNEWMVRKEAA